MKFTSRRFDIRLGLGLSPLRDQQLEVSPLDIGDELMRRRVGPGSCDPLIGARDPDSLMNFEKWS